MVGALCMVAQGDVRRLRRGVEMRRVQEGTVAQGSPVQRPFGFMGGHWPDARPSHRTVAFRSGLADSGACTAPPLAGKASCMSAAVEHVPIRPDWTCGACGNGTPWPCAPAKVQLSEQYSQREGKLLRYLAERMWDAFADGLCAVQHQHVVPPVLRERFLDWVALPLVSGRSNAASVPSRLAGRAYTSDLRTL